MSKNFVEMKWKRPSLVEYPKVWYRFKARDLNSDELVEYRIEDLLASKVDEAFKHMRENYLKDEPITQALGGENDDVHFEDYAFAWRSFLAQKMPLVCYKEGSDEIVGLNWIYVSQKDDDFMEALEANVKSPLTKTVLAIVSLVYSKFNAYETYGVDEYMSSLGLTVDKKYRGRSIGDHFLATRKIICKAFGLKITSTIFTSNYSSRNAENVGFKTDVAIRYDDVMKVHPEYNLSNIKSKELAVKTLVI